MSGIPQAIDELLTIKNRRAFHEIVVSHQVVDFFFQLSVALRANALPFGLKSTIYLW
jgi:hypothetical protein